MAKEWITSNPEISYKSATIARWISGSVVLRTFATGIEWGFAAANLPRDIQHIWFAARTFQDGKWKPLYSSTGPVYGLQMGRDLVTVASDAILRRGRTTDYINEGGGMEFLTHQGRIFRKGRHLEGPFDKIMDFLGYVNETSEIITRLAVRERTIRKRAKEQGISMEEARKNKKITQEATFAARDYLDFNQGGGIVKAVDNAVPYLSAGVQGTRGLWRAMVDNKVESMYKFAQYAALVSGLYIAAKKLAPLTMENLIGNIDMQNNLVIPIGDQYAFEDEQGQTRYIYLKMPLDPGQKFFKVFFEASTDKWLGNEIDVNAVVDSLKSQSPVGITNLPPTMGATIGYMANKDFWMNEDIWRTTEPFKYQLPKRITGEEVGGSEEEFTPGQTPKAYVDVGAFTGLSPERTKFVVEELLTSGSMWTYLLGKGYDELTGPDSKESNEQHLAMALARFPIIKRFIGITNPYSKFARTIDEVEEKHTLERFVQNRNLDALVDGYLYKNTVERKEVFDYIRVTAKDKDTRDRLTDRFEWEESIKDLPEKSFWKRIKSLPVEAKAEAFVRRLDAAAGDNERTKQIWREFGIVVKAGGIVSKDFRREVSKLRIPRFVKE